MRKIKKADIIVFVCLLLFFLPFFLFDNLKQFYFDFNQRHGYVISFIKFFMLAPIGELIGLRLRTGKYYEKGFGLLPRAIVWGILGITIKMAFDIFSSGAPAMLHLMFDNFPADVMKQDFSWLKVIGAFSISLTLNLFYAPVLMTAHRIADEHIVMNNGTIKGFFKTVKVQAIMININWQVMWSFVFKKTIPLFWIPMQTINFLLPKDYRILVAALLGIVLGVILEISSLKEIGK